MCTLLNNNNTCHELNFFLFKRDKEFYNQVVYDENLRIRMFDAVINSGSLDEPN